MTQPLTDSHRDALPVYLHYRYILFVIISNSYTYTGHVLIRFVSDSKRFILMLQALTASQTDVLFGSLPVVVCEYWLRRPTDHVISVPLTEMCFLRSE